MVIIIKYWCWVMWVFFIGRLELIEVGSELELSEGDCDVCMEFWLFCDDVDVEFDDVFMVLFIWWEFEFLFEFECCMLFGLLKFLFLWFLFINFKVLDFEFFLVCRKFFKFFFFGGGGVFRLCFLKEEEFVEKFCVWLFLLIGWNLSFWLWLEFMFLKFFIKLFVSNFSDVEYMLGELEKCWGELIVYCFSRVCFFFVSGKLNGVGVFLLM